MAAGMVWGMVASVSLVQALIRLSYGRRAIGAAVALKSRGAAAN